MSDKLHGEEAASRRRHIPIAEWTDKEIFIDLFEFMAKHLNKDENVHKFFDDDAQNKNDYLFRKVVVSKDTNGVEWIHTVYVKYTKVKRP